MIASKEKLDDMKRRKFCLDRIALCIEQGKTDAAKAWGVLSKQIQEDILHHDYTEDDKRRARIDRLLAHKIKI